VELKELVARCRAARKANDQQAAQDEATDKCAPR
jgi:hypothetical protein